MDDFHGERAFLARQIAQWPLLETDDLIKASYQAAHGCGHFVRDEASARDYIIKEMADAQGDAPLAERLAGGFSRVHLAAYRQSGASADTLARLFVLTAQRGGHPDGDVRLSRGLDAICAMADAGELPQTCRDVHARVAAYRAAGCPATHHSEGFRRAYHPAYRVIRSDWAAVLPMLSRIDGLMREKERVLVAIDGGSASGKTTLAGVLADVYGATVVHMDDFFLQPHQRTAERFAEPGGNVDRERFAKEVLGPMRRGESFAYRPYDCHAQTITPGRTIAPGKLCVVEGAYSLHPEMADAYDLKVFMRIDEAGQRARILKRNGEAMLARFVREWIPLENAYFDKTDILHRCDMRLHVDPEGGHCTWEA